MYRFGFGVETVLFSRFKAKDGIVSLRTRETFGLRGSGAQGFTPWNLVLCYKSAGKGTQFVDLMPFGHASSL